MGEQVPSKERADQILGHLDQCADSQYRFFELSPETSRELRAYIRSLQSAPESPPAGCEDWWHLRPYGYAPGGYIIRCHTCKQQAWNCDKRALNCASCATKAWRKANEQG